MSFIPTGGYRNFTVVNYGCNNLIKLTIFAYKCLLAGPLRFDLRHDYDFGAVVATPLNIHYKYSLYICYDYGNSLLSFKPNAF